MKSWTQMAVSIFAVVVLPALAEAQAPYSVSMRSAPFQPIPIPHPQAQPPEDHTAAAGLSNRIVMDFPVRFFDIDRETIRITPQGYVHFDDDNSWQFTNDPIPDPAAPNSYIGPWWSDSDLRSGGGHLKTQILGEEPNRTLVIEWKINEYNDKTALGDVQLWLTENSSTIEFHYGLIDPSSAWQTTVGIENDDGTMGYEVFQELFGTACSPSCNHLDWMENTVIVFSQGPELRTSEVVGEPEGFAGLPMPLRASVMNMGGKLAEDFTIRFYVSKKPQFDATAIHLVTLDGDLRSLQPQEVATFTASPRLPIDLEEGQYYILAEADPYQNVPETNRSDNFAAYGPFKIGVRAANLVVEWVDAPDLAQPGEVVEVRFKIGNTGNLDAKQISFAIGLASAPLPSPAWPSLTTGVIDSLPMGNEEVLVQPIEIPAELKTGAHHVFVELNKRHEVFEHEYGDNVGISNPLVISDDDLVVLNEHLPVAQFQSHYSVRLLAAGGDGRHHWRVAEGSVLPPGLSLSEEVAENGEIGTFLHGIPSRVDTFEFTLELRSGGAFLAHTFSLEVLPVEFDLTIMTETLADAAFNLAYVDELFALGGTPPYTWEARGELPLGLLLRSDGVISGRPQRDGSFTILFRVVDVEGREASKELTLNVSPPNGLTCVTRELPTVRIGDDVEVELVAAGGVKAPDGTYTWTSGASTRLATEIGESTETWQGPPPGFSLDPKGLVRMNPTQFGTYVWRVHVQDNSPGSPRLECPIRFEVSRDHGLTVLTTRLPTAVAGRSYRAVLEASGGEGRLRWAEYGGGRVLDDLGLQFDTEGGSIFGTPAATALNGEDEREFVITMRVEDERNRIGIGVVTLTVKSGVSESVAPDEKEANCQAGSGVLSPWALVLLGYLVSRRRR